MGAYDCDCINNLEYERSERKQKEQSQSTIGQLNDGARSTARSTNLIDRQEAISALQKCRKHCIDPFDSYHIDIQDAENELIKLPSAQLSVPIGLDLIDRKSAIAEVCKRECNESEPCKGECGAVIALEILPTIQAKPRGGHWIKDNTDDCPPVFKMFRICSECGCVRTEETKYCPNCGVYMEVDKNGTNR